MNEGDSKFWSKLMMFISRLDEINIFVFTILTKVAFRSHNKTITISENRRNKGF